MPAKFILCHDGSYLAIRNIIRLYVEEDTITRQGAIKASTIGPAMPFKVAEYDTKEDATLMLQGLILQAEEEPE